MRQLDVGDLEALTRSAEGWFLEYKGQVTDAAKIAKSVSSFANTHGGWLFYSIEEKSKDDPVAGTFPGIACSELDAALQRMRQAVAMHVAPSPHFETKVLRGPCVQIGLAEERAVICVEVPWSIAAPHVHKDGRIYRRVADGSEPKAENDRFVLDQLWRRADETREVYRKWIDRDPEFSDAEKERPYLRLMLDPDLLSQREAWSDITLSEMREIMKEGRTDASVGLPFDTIHTSARGFIARQNKGNDPANLNMTWRFHRSLESDIIIPFDYYNLSLDMIPNELYGFEGALRFQSISKNYEYQHPSIIDLNHLYSILVGIVAIQRRLLERAGWTEGFFFKARLLNIWRTCPFMDVARVLDSFEAHGLPVSLESKLTVPPGGEPDTFRWVDAYNNVENDHARAHVQATMLFMPIAHALGIPNLLENEVDSEKPYYEQLQDASARAMKRQRRQNVGFDRSKD